MYYNIEFNGFEYPVVIGSQREKLMIKARIANRLGQHDTAVMYHIDAITSPGCAKAHKAGVRHG
jgi:hypothetical protein